MGLLISGFSWLVVFVAWIWVFCFWLRCSGWGFGVLRFGIGGFGDFSLVGGCFGLDATRLGSLGVLGGVLVGVLCLVV